LGVTIFKLIPSSDIELLTPSLIKSYSSCFIISISSSDWSLEEEESSSSSFGFENADFWMRPP